MKKLSVSIGVVLTMLAFSAGMIIREISTVEEALELMLQKEDVIKENKKRKT